MRKINYICFCVLLFLALMGCAMDIPIEEENGNTPTVNEQNDEQAHPTEITNTPTPIPTKAPTKAPTPTNTPAPKKQYGAGQLSYSKGSYEVFFVVNYNTHVYHRSNKDGTGCGPKKYIAYVTSEYFATKADALNWLKNNGYKACGTCNPY